MLHLGPTISLLKGGYGGAIFCFKVILLDTFLERLTPLLALTRPMSRIVCFTRSSVPEEIEGVLVVLQSPIILHFFLILVSRVNSERLTRADRLANGYLTER